MMRIGIDIGGTFTDFVVHNPDGGTLSTFKLLSDNSNPASAVLLGLKHILDGSPADIIHGSTVATNALLERKGARTALITTRGFKDVLQIGRQNRPVLYDFINAPPPALVPSNLRYEINERVNYRGEAIIPLRLDTIDEIICQLQQEDVESVAICFLFSFLHPEHELIVADLLRKAGFFVSASCEIMPEFREYERTSTTVVNAYVSPILDGYLSTIQSSITNSKIQVMQSNGGMINLQEARIYGSKCILSGPAGGIVGAQRICELIHKSKNQLNLGESIKIITFDMGGTSTDVSLIDGKPSLTTDSIVGGFPISLPLLDIHTIGSGGGSIAYVDIGGTLRVGPQSAGASPGPACYGKGMLPTVTDANIVLGRLLPDHILGGQLNIYPDRAQESIADLGKKLNLDPIRTALGVIEVVNIQMERALRVISVERGHDPKDFSLFSFGGAGGLHACALARHMGIPRVWISRFASTLSALGMLTANIIKDYVQTVMLPGTTQYEILSEKFSPLIDQGKLDIKNQGIENRQIEIYCSLDIRYAGQSYELNIPFTPQFLDVFNEQHSLSYGYAYPDKEITIVNLRVRAVGNVSPIIIPEIDFPPTITMATSADNVSVATRNGTQLIPLFLYDNLQPGEKLIGPALIASPDTTIFLEEADTALVDGYLNLLIEIAPVDKYAKY